MANYKITSAYAGGKCLNIYGDNVTSLNKNQNVTIWSDSGSAEQTWVIDSLGTGVLIKSAVNTSFALNAYRSSTTKYNCDVYPWSGNEADSKVNFVATTGGYRIKLTNYNMYLTAGGTANGSDVYWTAATGGANQVWACTAVSSIGPQNHSYYNGIVNSINLYVIETDASNIMMVNLQKKYAGLVPSPYYGINGGFFNSSSASDVSCYNYAINNGSPVGPNGTGSINELGFAAMAYVNGAIKLFPSKMETAEQLKAALGGATPTWVQGGGNLMLGNANWTTAQLGFGSDALVNSTGRTAIVSNTSTKKVYLMVSRESSAKSIVQFRTAIYQYLGITNGMTNFVGLLLDGGGSSALKAKGPTGQTVGATTSRRLCQIIALKNPN